MSENLKKFLEAASKDADLTEKVKNAKSGEEIAELAKALGFALTEEDFKAPEGEISDDELEGVAGGYQIPRMLIDILSKKYSALSHYPKACDCYQGAGGA